MINRLLRSLGFRQDASQPEVGSPDKDRRGPLFEGQESGGDENLFEGQTHGSKSRDVGLFDAAQSGWFNHFGDELYQDFTIGAEDVVLDVGCGDGGSTMFCAMRGAHVVFTDLERSKVENLESRVARSPARGYEALVCDTNPLPIQDEYASRVMAMEMLEHTDDPDSILRELVRVGKPGALYLITVPDPVSEKLQQGLAPEGYFKEPNHVRIFERDEFVQTVERAGLEVVRKGSYGFYWTMWMLMFWISEANSGKALDGAALDKVGPPYHPLLESWATTWSLLLKMPEGAQLREKMDEFAPKAQIIVARKKG